MNIITIAKRLSMLVLLSAPVAGWAAESVVPAAPQLAAKAWVLMDGASGQVLVENNADERLPPASLTKLMTAYIATKEIEGGRIAALLQRIDADARAAGLAMVPLKGSALHALGIYAPGERPMADIDLLVREDDAAAAIELLLQLGYVESFAQWKHRVFKPATDQPFAGLGEHRDTPVNIELHTGIRERLPVSMVDIPARIYPRTPRPGLNPYPSNGALMSHLLLHAAGNLCGRSLRLLHLHDIARLAARLSASDWDVLWDDDAESPWWALPPLQLVARHYPQAIPAAVLARLARDCPLLLRTVSRRQSLTRVSCSELWLHAFAGIEWSRSLREAGRYLRNRVSPPDEARRERADMARTQLWLQGQGWVTSPHRRRVLTWLTRPVPRMDVLYVVRAALEDESKAQTPPQDVATSWRWSTIFQATRR